MADNANMDPIIYELESSVNAEPANIGRAATLPAGQARGGGWFLLDGKALIRLHDGHRSYVAWNWQGIQPL